MKKVVVCALFYTVFCVAASSHAEDSAGRNLYLGIGGSYAVEDFEYDDIDFDDTFSLKVDFDDSWGLDLKLGYHVNDFISLEAVYDHYAEFKTDQSISESVTVDSTTVTGSIGMEGGLDINSVMLAGKLSIPWKIRPFIIAGAGLMHAGLRGELSASLAVNGISESVYVSDSDSDTQGCAKVGAGFDFFATDNVSVGVEGAYVFGFEDATFRLNPFSEDIEVDIRYYGFTLGAAYHF
jgi:opacity protein-like surface antigen